MQIVIDIDNDLYTRLFNNGENDVIDMHRACVAIRKGNLLPKGHGDLTDKNYLLNILRCEEYETCTWRNCSECNREKCIKKHNVVGAPTIIEADKAESEE